MSWTFGNARGEQKISLRTGRFLLDSQKNKQSKFEYCSSGTQADQVRLTVDDVDTGDSQWRWEFVKEQTLRPGRGELQLDIQVRGGPIEVTKHWVVYPETALVREWLTIHNSSSKDVRLRHVHFLNSRLLGATPDKVEMSYVTGGGNFNGSQLLKTERLKADYIRKFDSNELPGGAYSAYLPLLLVRDLASANCMAFGWDYMGHWSLQVDNQSNDQVTVGLEIAGFDRTLSPGEDVQTPKTFTAPFFGDLDQIGNEILDWQYRSMWEYTNPEYFGKTRWAVDWPDPWVGDGGTPSADNWGRRLALDMRYIDLLRESGGDLLWDDAGWYDKWGNWRGPNWRMTTGYLRKHDMRWVLWEPCFLATPESSVAQEHPDWLVPGRPVFEQSIPETRKWQNDLLDKEVSEWQDFQWRYDIAPAASATDTTLLGADQQFRALLEQFKTAHPGSGIDACDGGGRWISYDIAKFAESGEYTDGGVGPYSGYYSSLIVPPDKVHNVSDFDHTYYNASSDRTHLALNPTWYRDPGDGADVEAIRKDWEIYRFLLTKGVAGRWSHVFRPRVSGDDPIWYFQRMNRDGSSGVIITKHAKTGAEYLLISKPLADAAEDKIEGGPTAMTRISTTGVAVADTGIYSDPMDGELRYYGVPGEIYGPVNFRYEGKSGATSYVTHIEKPGVSSRVESKSSLGMAFQVGAEAITITELGQFDPGNNRGKYTLTLVRARDKAILGTAMLDMRLGHVDALGFKYAKLSTPIHLEPGMREPVVVYPGGVQPSLKYEVHSYHSGKLTEATGAQLLANGISLHEVPPGELLFLNLSDYPGSGRRKAPPAPPVNVTKRRGTNLGCQGTEIAWSAAAGATSISYYEVLKENSPIGRSAKGTYLFDHSLTGRGDLEKEYQVIAVDSDGNRSSPVTAELHPGDPESYEPLGDFSPTQGQNGWRYEQSFNGHTYEELTWQQGGYEGFWAGSGLGRIGRLWMQPSPNAEIARTFVASRDMTLTIAGNLEMDPSAEPDLAVFARIDHGKEQLWPSTDWSSIPVYGSPLQCEIRKVHLLRGDTVRFVIKRTTAQRAQPIIWSPRITVDEPS